MPDAASISVAITAVKTAIDIAKSINDADKSLEKAELKLKIAELMETLAKAKIEMVQTQELIQEKNLEIEKLNILLNSKTSSQNNALSEECIEILKLLGSESNPPAIDLIPQSLQISLQKVKYYLDILAQRDFVYFFSDIYAWNRCDLTQKGRTYLFENNLL